MELQPSPRGGGRHEHAALSHDASEGNRLLMWLMQGQCAYFSSMSLSAEYWPPPTAHTTSSTHREHWFRRGDTWWVLVPMTCLLQEERMLADELGERGAGVTKTKAPALTTAATTTAVLSASFMESVRMFLRVAGTGTEREKGSGCKMKKSGATCRGGSMVHITYVCEIRSLPTPRRGHQPVGFVLSPAGLLSTRFSFGQARIARPVARLSCAVCSETIHQQK